MFRSFQPDLMNWHTEGRGVYVSNDGLRRCRKANNRWLCDIRSEVEQEWRELPECYLALHAAQSACDRATAKTVAC